MSIHYDFLFKNNIPTLSLPGHNEVSTPMQCMAPIKVVSKTEQSSEKYLQELPIKGFVLEAVPLSSLEHKTNEPYAGRANKGLFTKPPYPLANDA